MLYIYVVVYIDVVVGYLESREKVRKKKKEEESKVAKFLFRKVSGGREAARAHNCYTLGTEVYINCCLSIYLRGRDRIYSSYP